MIMTYELIVYNHQQASDQKLIFKIKVSDLR